MSEVNPIILIQMLNQYHNYKEGNRTFRFVKNNLMKVHTETDKEMAKRKSILSKKTRDVAARAIRDRLDKYLDGKIGNLYISDKMKNIAVPLQLSTSESGYGVLSTGSRIDIPEGRFIRAFTYWEKVNDIDISVFAIKENGEQMEFSWRNMWCKQSEEICFSGDETNGYYGGSEYFDIDPELFKKNNPDYRYLIFCDNIYTGGGSIHFKDCEATGGFMIREKMEPNTRGYGSEGKTFEIFDPKTVETSFKLQSDSSFCYMFAIDLEKRQMVWLDISREGNHAVAGNTSMSWLLNYMSMTEVYSVYDLFVSMCTNHVENPKYADILVTDEPDIKPIKENAMLIHSWDTEKIFKYLQAG